jgi:hypothetical protein
VAALLARAAERVDDGSDTEWQVARLTVELTRPVPVGRRLDLSIEVERAGRKVSMVGARLLDGGTEVAAVRALRIRRAPVALPVGTVDPSISMGPAGAGEHLEVTWGIDVGVAFHTHACEHRFAAGGWEIPGPVSTWIRLLVPLLRRDCRSERQGFRRRGGDDQGRRQHHLREQ